MKKVSVVGLGKLGLPFAACLAEGGFFVYGVDINKEAIDFLRRGVSPLYETDLQKFLKKNQEKLFFTTNHASAIEETDVTFIVVATPSDKEGNFSNVYVESALKSLSLELQKSKKKDHIFVINSTLMPTSVEEKLIPLIEKYSKRKLNHGFELCYVPDFVALGSVIKDFRNPDMVVIGESNQKAGSKISLIYKKMCENSPPIHRMSIINAEITKISLNMYMTTKISFVNMLANVCGRVKGADVDVVTDALGSDKRISPRYFKGGLSFGGTCFPRDVKAFSALTEKVGYGNDLMKAVDKINILQDEYLLQMVLKSLGRVKEQKVSILGLAFKPNTPEIEKSPGVFLVRELLKRNIQIVAYDALALGNVKKVFGEKITYATSPEESLFQSSVWVIATPDKKFKSVVEKQVPKKMRVVVDCWRILDQSKLGSKVEYEGLGINR